MGDNTILVVHPDVPVYVSSHCPPNSVYLLDTENMLVVGGSGEFPQAGQAALKGVPLRQVYAPKREEG